MQGFLPSLSDLELEFKNIEEREQQFASLLRYAVCGVLESRLGLDEAVLLYDAEERMILVMKVPDGEVNFLR